LVHAALNFYVSNDCVRSKILLIKVNVITELFINSTNSVIYHVNYSLMAKFSELKYLNLKLIMRIAFDLDNTLIRNSYDFPVEKPIRNFWAKILHFEPLRHGIIEIINFYRQHNCEIWVYTTSFRSTFYIRKIFWLYGIQLDGVVNQTIHNQEVNIRTTKYPPQFGIDILIDDSEGVAIEGKKYNFEVIVIAPDDEKWVEKLVDNFSTNNT
jgi:hypothetical protein